MEKEEIKKLVKDGKVIPFIGAGFSKCLELPTWSELIRDLAHDLDWDPDVFMQSGNSNYLQLAEYYTLEKGNIGELRHRISQKMVVTEQTIKSSKLHENLVRLNPKIIYTTNYDDAIELAYKAQGKKYHVIRNINDFITSNDESTLIYKFHGDFIDDSSLVLTESSYFRRLSFDDPLDLRLRSDTLNKTLMFLGYSLSDINMRYIFYKLSQLQQSVKRNELYKSAIMVSFNITEIQKKILTNWKIESYELDPIDKTKSLTEFLQFLNE